MLHARIVMAGRSLAASMQGVGLGGEEDAEGGDMDGMVGTIMRQLLSKDVLHQSMKVAASLLPTVDDACPTAKAQPNPEPYHGC